MAAGVDVVKKYLSLVKFSHTIFAMPFAVIGYLLGIAKVQQAFQLKLFLLVVLCMVFARSAAMAFNRYIDRHIDKVNIRTATREIPAGVIHEKSALFFVIVNSLFFITTTFFINTICFYLSPVALLVVLGYSYTKRFTAWCHFVLGLGLSLAPIGAYLAVVGQFAVLPLMFSLVVLCWVGGFDVIYALQDEEFDRSQNLNSMPVLLGKRNALILSSVFHVVAALLVTSAGYIGHFNIFYWIGSVCFIGLLIYQHTLVKPNDLSKVNVAFFTTNGIASVVFAVFFALAFVSK